jgi:hypothetical protein
VAAALGSAERALRDTQRYRERGFEVRAQLQVGAALAVSVGRQADAAHAHAQAFERVPPSAALALAALRCLARSCRSPRAG